ncbi:MAG: hypothetical protein WCE52_22625 [Candidatus Acidiferrum sp.]
MALAAYTGVPVRALPLQILFNFTDAGAQRTRLANDACGLTTAGVAYILIAGPEQSTTHL